MGIPDVSNESAVGLPSLQQSRRAVWDYYRIEFLGSGYPGRRMGESLEAHPLYGTYVISDYIAQFRRTRETRFLDAAIRVADAAIGQMAPVGNGLAFMYRRNGTGVSSKTHDFYSGLTQARYVECLSKILTLPGGERFQEPLAGVLASLRVPVEQGGVAWRTPGGGLLIEEYPADIPDCTLNGWTTATCILADFARRSRDDAAEDIFQDSVRGLEDIIQLYDVPELCNSRYGLTGPASFRIRSDGSRVTLRGCEVFIPGAGIFAANDKGDPAGAVLNDQAAGGLPASEVRFTVSLSRVSWPAPNRLRLRLHAEAPGTASVEIGGGPYHPLRKSLVATIFASIQPIELVAGENVFDIAVPWTDAELVAYPTNFGKAIAGRQFNQYHRIHVDTLRKIVKVRPSDILSYFAERWARYPERWADLPEYADPAITWERFDPAKHS